MQRGFLAVPTALIALCIPMNAQAQVGELSPGSIWVVTMEPDVGSALETVRTQGAWSPWSPSPRWNDVPVNELREGFGKLVDQLNLLDMTQLAPNGYALDQIEINLAVGAGGSVGIVSGNLSGGLKLVLRRDPTQTQ